MKDLARRLWDARKNGTVAHSADVTVTLTMEEAYAVQDEVVRLSAHSIRGFKVGSASEEAQRLLGTSEPGSSPVLEPYLHVSPARLVIAPTQTPAVEGSSRTGWVEICHRGTRPTFERG